MNQASDSRQPAVLCALLLLLCALVTFPVAEIGMNDDWSYIQSARVLARTGHVVYNGWAAPMLGWQLFLGALFAKLFGPSFTAFRASTLLVALLTAFLTHRTFVRAGVNSRNATIGTLAMVLSPLFLPLAVSFMSDMGSLFCVVVCLYACLRALQAQSDRAVLAWLAFAALSNAFGGTVRQIAWLGVLVMFPCAVWLLRRRPHVLAAGALLYVISLTIVFGSLHWYLHQPFAVPEKLMNGYLDRSQLRNLVAQLLSLFLSFPLLLLPILFGFVPASLRNRRAVAFLAVGIVCVPVPYFLAMHHAFFLPRLVAPFTRNESGSYVTAWGVVHIFPLKGLRPIVLTLGLRLAITAAVLFTITCFVAYVLANRGRTSTAQTPLPISRPSLLILLFPFVIAYVALLMPRGLRDNIFDRYLLLLFPIALIFLLRFYQDYVAPDLPLISKALVLLFALYAVAGTHDAFSFCRAEQSAVSELHAAGIPDTFIDGGVEHNGMTQIERIGYMNDPRARLPAWARITQTLPFPKGCEPWFAPLTPAIVPGYALSFDPAVCGGLSHFAPVAYRAWLTQRTVSIYVVNTVKPEPGQR